MDQLPADRAELTDLLARQGLWLDERRFDETASIFTEDATVDTRGGRAEGRQALAEQAHRNHARFARTQHVTSNVLIDVAGGRAGRAVPRAMKWSPRRSCRRSASSDVR